MAENSKQIEKGRKIEIEACGKIEIETGRKIEIETVGPCIVLRKILAQVSNNNNNKISLNL